jgi:hypothetical protein
LKNKIDTKLTKEPYVFQVCFRLNSLINYYGRQVVANELLNESQDDVMLEVHIENLYGSYGLEIMQDAISMIFINELKKVG